MKKTVLITGSAKGIGKACIEKFASEGYNVVINYLTSEKEALELKNTVENLYGIKTLCIKADISNEKEVKKMIAEVASTFGNIDVLINNANYEQDNNYLEKTKEEFLRVLEVNVVGTFLVTKYVSKYMDKGIVINISSLDATDTYRELSMDYCASKAGINSLTQTFSLALPNIKFISIMLPWVKTESVEEMFDEYLENELKRTGQERLIEPEEVAEKVYEIINNNVIKSGSVVKFEIERRICMEYNINNLPDFFSVRNKEQIDYSFEGMQYKKCFVFFDNGFCSSYVETNKRDIKYIWDGFLLFVDKNISLEDIKKGINLHESRLVALQRTKYFKKANSDEVKKYILDKLKEINSEYILMPDKNEENGYPATGDMWSTRDTGVLNDAVECIESGVAKFFPVSSFKFDIHFLDSKLPSFNYVHKGGVSLYDGNSYIFVRLLDNENKLSEYIRKTEVPDEEQFSVDELKKIK